MQVGLVDQPGVSGAFERLFQHGGDINSARIAFPEAPAPWIDLSTGINPAPYPLPALPPEAWTRLPSPAELMALQAAAGARYGVPAEAVVAAPGTQALIQWLPRLFRARSVAILGPTYSGHAAAWRAAGADIVEATSPRDLTEASHIVVVNPNNPDGRRLPYEALNSLAAQAGAHDGVLIVDEAFADFELSGFAADLAPATVVLRSFGKTYGLAGARLGFALARPEIATRLRDALGAWPVSGVAIAIARQALADDAWLVDAGARLRADAQWLDQRLVAAGFAILGGAPLFRLAARADAADVFAGLCAKGVLTRPFRAEPTWLRFGLPHPEDRARVEAALQAVAPTQAADFTSSAS